MNRRFGLRRGRDRRIGAVTKPPIAARLVINAMGRLREVAENTCFAGNVLSSGQVLHIEAREIYRMGRPTAIMEDQTDDKKTSRPDAAEEDSIDRRGMLKCMAWAGAGLLWTMEGGIPSSRLLAQPMKKASSASFSFVQISDSHIGFNKPANPDVTATMQAAITKINGLSHQPDFIIHTGDLTHQSKPKEFDDMDGVMQGSKVKDVFYVPGEHDTSVDDGKLYREKYGKNSKGTGWYSMDHKGVHLVGLVNVVQLEGMGQLGQEQLAWLEKDLKDVPAS